MTLYTENKRDSLKPNYLPVGLPGLPSLKNRGALDWNRNGLAAYGNGTDVILLNVSELVPYLFLPSEHKSFVNRVSWNPHARSCLSENSDKQPVDLVSIDSADMVVMWDIEKCTALSRFTHPDYKGLSSLKWSNGADVWQKSKLFLLYSHSNFVVLDIVTQAYQNIFIETIPNSLSSELPVFDFDCEPACSTSSSIAFLGDHYVYIKPNWDPLKMKQERITGLKSVVYNPKSSSPRLSVSQESQSAIKRTGIRKLVSEIVGADYSTASSGLISGNSSSRSSTTIQFHKNLSYHLVVATLRDIFLINTQFNVILNTFSLDRSASNLVQVLLVHSRPAIVTIHENGAVCLRKYCISGTHAQSTTLETIATSDPPRLSSKKSEVLGAIINRQKHQENQIVLHLSDGRFLKYNILRIGPHQSQKAPTRLHSVTPMTPFPAPAMLSAMVSGSGLPPEKGLSPKVAESPLPAVKGLSAKVAESPLPTINGPVQGVGPRDGTRVQLLPIDKLLKTVLVPEIDIIKIKLKQATVAIGTLTCIKSYPNSNLMVAGTSVGYILVLNLEEAVEGSGQPRCVIKKRFSVHSNSAVSGIEFISQSEIISYANLSFSANPKCEMVVTEIWTGASKTLKQDEPHHIALLSVSPSAQCMILVYKNGMAPAELWDMERKQIIKPLPNKLPTINCAVWKEPVEGVKEEVFYMTDLGTFLFTFRVEGHRFSSATCVKLETAGNMGGVPVSLVSRGKLVFRADSSGTLVIFDTEKKTCSPGVPIGRGPLLRLESGTGDFSSCVLAQFSDSLELWHLSEIKRLKVLAGPKHPRVADFCWVNGAVAFIPRGGAGGISFLPVANDVHNPSATSSEFLTKMGYFVTPQKSINRFHRTFHAESLTHAHLLSVFQELHMLDEFEFWTIVSHTIQKQKSAESYSELNAFSDEKFYKEVMVKLAQCVWFSDMSKREEVAKVLLWAGELEKSAEMLLDTEPSDASKYISNGMKAALSVGAATLPESTKAVLKIVATNLIASGETDAGLELLCLLCKHSEAVKYVESANDWSKAILLCKSSLNHKQAQECLSKYAHYLNSQRQVLKSASVYCYIGKYDRAIEVLFGGRKRHLCYLLLLYSEKSGINLDNLSDHVKTAIRLDFARLLFDHGLLQEALELCDKLGPDAKDLRSEFEILGA